MVDPSFSGREFRYLPYLAKITIRSDMNCYGTSDTQLLLYRHYPVGSYLDSGHSVMVTQFSYSVDLA